MLKTLSELSACLVSGSSPYAPGSFLTDSRLLANPWSLGIFMSVVGRDQEPASQATFCLHFLDQG